MHRGRSGRGKRAGHVSCPLRRIKHLAPPLDIAGEDFASWIVGAVDIIQALARRKKPSDNGQDRLEPFLNGVHFHSKIFKGRGADQQKRALGRENHRARDGALKALNLEITESEQQPFLPAVRKDKVPRGSGFHSDFRKEVFRGK